MASLLTELKKIVTDLSSRQERNILLLVGRQERKQRRRVYDSVLDVVESERVRYERLEEEGEERYRERSKHRKEALQTLHAQIAQRRGD